VTTAEAVVLPAPQRARPLRRTAFLGPAFVAGIAYIDPGNFAANFAAGSRFGFELLWVVLAANAVAAFMQSLSAKLGLATGRNLAEACRDQFGRRVASGLWVQAEMVVLATDLAEIVGGALALNLLAGIPLPIGALGTAAVACALATLRDCGNRPLELAMTLVFVVVAGGVCIDALRSSPDVGAMARGLVPNLSGGSTLLLLATAIVGATVMPHALYLHSALAQSRPHPEISLRRMLHLHRLDIGVAMGAAGLVNAGMLIAAAAALPAITGGLAADHAALATEIGAGAAFAFAVALLVAGLGSSGVGTCAGEVVMSGFVRRRVPRHVRRLITVVPCVAMLQCGMPATTALLLSQVVLGLGVPFALVPLVRLTSDRRLMGELVNRRGTTITAAVCTAAVVAVGITSLATL
jgi:manganese transport protein